MFLQSFYSCHTWRLIAYSTLYTEKNFLFCEGAERRELMLSQFKRNTSPEDRHILKMFRGGGVGQLDVLQNVVQRGNRTVSVWVSISDFGQVACMCLTFTVAKVTESPAAPWFTAVGKNNLSKIVKTICELASIVGSEVIISSSEWDHQIVWSRST